MQVTIEPIGPHNRSACLALEVAAEQRGLVATNEKSLAQAAANPACVPLAACCDGHVAGFLMVEPRGKAVASIHRLMVDRRYQRRGIARAAMRLVIEDLQEQGYQTIYLSCRPENAAARRLFESLGFVQHEIESDGEVVYRLGPVAEIAGS
jgi:diamine N-acetyltransferase